MPSGGISSSISRGEAETEAFWTDFLRGLVKRRLVGRCQDARNQPIQRIALPLPPTERPRKIATRHSHARP